MHREEDDNYLSVGGWMWVQFVTAIPVIGLLMMIVWAVTGRNQTRKNYFRALFAWVFVLFGFLVTIAVLGYWPAIQNHLKSLVHQKP